MMAEGMIEEAKRDAEVETVASSSVLRRRSITYPIGVSPQMGMGRFPGISSDAVFRNPSTALEKLAWTVNMLPHGIPVPFTKLEACPTWEVDCF
jgi:hypothetical protein